MSIYRFHNSPVSSVTFHYAEGAPTVALIEASKDVTAEQIAAARVALSEKGLTLVPVTVDGKDRLQVGGFTNEQAVIDALAASASVKGTPEITQEASDRTQPKSTTKKFLEDNSFRLAGAFNLIGDIAMHAGGYKKVTAKFDKKENRPLTSAERKASVTSGTYELIGGGLYTVGGLNSLAFGNSKSEAPPLADRTANFIAHTIDPVTTALSTPKETGSFLHRHTADTTLAAYIVGAGVLFRKGQWEFQELSKKLPTAVGEVKKDLLRERKESISLMAYGGVSLLVKMLSLFVKESPKSQSEEDKPKSRNPVTRTINWFREKPLRIFGLGSLITDSLYAKHAYDTYNRVKDTPEAGKKSEYVFKVITTLSYFASDFLSAISSKNVMTKTLDADGERGVIAQAAQSIAAQPGEKRDELVSKTAEFLSEQPEIQKSGRKSIAASLKSQIEHSGKNPWSKRVEMSELTLHKQL